MDLYFTDGTANQCTEKTKTKKQKQNKQTNKKPHPTPNPKIGSHVEVKLDRPFLESNPRPAIVISPLG